MSIEEAISQSFEHSPDLCRQHNASAIEYMTTRGLDSLCMLGCRPIILAAINVST